MNSPAAPSRPDCFGDLDRVFPTGEEGLREVSAGCWDCTARVECLRAAATAREGGDVLAEEKALREDPDGMVGFMRRWSRRKTKAQREDS
ncbi:MAG: hypothetical protein K9K66_09065 [Desulfarculaceae bacterium]|nr:hypothetical protein [Desulfarculaceae bacterium]MCF8073119.1 hypothetical protein [Desulfarculaceae bacterium]MCF8101796.1 hypothetical protein [Desulfarculaceae bacterium]MCF8117360.1 hypothetical protein [Desulfarculaceae bacterium]